MMVKCMPKSWINPISSFDCFEFKGITIETDYYIERIILKKDLFHVIEQIDPNRGPCHKVSTYNYNLDLIEDDYYDFDELEKFD